MREILFRGKPKNKADYELLKTMYKDNCKDGFIYGSLVISHGKYYICIMALCQINSLVDNGTTTMFEVIPETVGEYTWLKDKNGERIFEGDVVLLKSDEEPYQVAFDECCFQVYSHSVCYVMDIFYDHDIEVIGNIHDNPELLEG
jgi:hypothetical protein